MAQLGPPPNIDGDTMPIPGGTRAAVRRKRAPRLERGVTLGTFRVLRLLGEGGMGEVYLARDTTLGRRVALKIIRSDHLDRPGAVTDFLREARAIAAFNHPNIVSIYSAGVDSGIPWVALEYVAGKTLRQWLDAARPAPREALRIAMAVADALVEAHERRITHRDLKPENVLLPPDGRVRVVDFGLAKVLAGPPRAHTRAAAPDGESESQQTTADSDDDSVDEDQDAGAGDARALAGTPPYMAPEQWSLAEQTTATDIWALGVMLYELLAGERPFEDGDVSQLARKVTSPGEAPQLPPIDDMPAGAAELVARCLDKQASSRPRAKEVRATIERILGSERAAAEAAQEENPFRGLAAFSERDARSFFGRESEIAAFLERLRTEQIVPIVGPSGAGKSSFLQAGVLPRLREQGRWHTIQLRPGSDPFRALATRLLSIARSHSFRRSAPTRDMESPPSVEPPSQSGDAAELAGALAQAPSLLALKLAEIAQAYHCHVLLVVDALEELSTLVEDDAIRSRFLEAICTAAEDPEEPVRVVFTLRDDFLGRLAQGATARDVLGRLFLLRSPDEKALSEILTRPVADLGYAYDDPTLVPEMLASIKGERASLPLLQFVASLLWDRRDTDKKLLLRAAYDEMGGVGGALARHADSVLEGLTQKQVDIARTLLLRLVTPDRTRRTLLRSELLDGLGEGAQEVIERLVSARLLSARRAGRPASAASSDVDGTLETEITLAHESLIASFTQLARWIDEGREELVVLAEVQQAAELWAKRGSREDDAWQGDALHDAARVLGRASTRLPDQVRRFLAAGEAKERRRRRRRRGLFGLAIAAALLVAAGSLAAAFMIAEQRRQADTQRERAEAQGALAEHRRAEVLRKGAEAALRRGDALEAQAMLRSALEIEDSRSGRALWVRARDERQLWHMRFGLSVIPAYSPDGKMLAIGRGDGPIVLLDSQTLREITTLRRHGTGLSEISISKDASRLLSAFEDGEIYLWNLADKTYLHRQLTPKRSKILPDADRGVVIGAAGESLVALDVRTGDSRVVAPLPASADPIFALSPNKDLVAIASGDEVHIHEVATGDKTAVLESVKGGVTSLVWGPGGRLAATDSAGAIHVWSTVKGSSEIARRPRALQGRCEPRPAIAFGDGGATIVAGCADKTIRFWDVETGAQREVLGDLERRADPLVSPDGRVLLLTEWFFGRISALRFHAREGLLQTSHSDVAAEPDFDGSGKTIVSTSFDKTVRVWVVASGRSRVVRHSSDACLTAAYSPDGSQLALGCVDGSVRLLEAGTFAERSVLRGAGGVSPRLAWGEGGRKLATLDRSGVVHLLDAETGREERSFGSPGRGNALSYSAVGDLVAAGNPLDGTVRLWDAKSGREEKALSINYVLGASLSPDGQLLAAGFHGGIAVWDVDGWTRRTIDIPGDPRWISFHPDSNHLGIPATTSARIHDVAKGASTPLIGHQPGTEVNYVHFSRDGKLAVTAGDDSTIRLWDAETGRPLWWAPALLQPGLRLFSHRGWERLDGEAESAPAPRGARWVQAVEQRARFVAQHDTRGHLCVHTHDGRLEIWDTARDERLADEPVPDLDAVLALPSGCATLQRGQVRLHDRSGANKLLRSGATAIGAYYRGMTDTDALPEHSELLVADDRSVIVFGPTGDELATIAAGPGITALQRIGGEIVVGYAEGALAVLATSPKGSARTFAGTSFSPSRVLRLEEGPADTVIAGYASGAVGVFDRETGIRLLEARVHGPVVHLGRADSKLFAVSELGDVATLDLSVLARPRCALLQEVWSECPAVWADGGLVADGPPAGHACQSSPPPGR